jgi:dienelactone hydrolase
MKFLLLLSSVVSLFPTDTLTVPDPAQATGLRVNLPLPDCTAQPSTCSEISALNLLDGFSVNPRIAVTFSGPVDTTTIRDNIFIAPTDAPFDVTWTNQIVYDPTTYTIYAKPENVLDPRREYRLTVFNPDGTSVSTTFTTLSATTWLDRAAADLPATNPSLTTIASYPFADLATLTLHQQTHVDPDAFQDETLPLGLISGVGSVRFATYLSPNYLNAQQTIDPIPTGVDPGPGNSVNTLYFHAVLPSSAKPATGYPVVVFGHGLGDSQYGGPTAVAPILASNGFAIVAINAVGHGYGPASTVILGLKDGQEVTIPAGGRSIPDPDGTIESDGGCVLLTNGFGVRDCLRQTAIDIMQLVRILKTDADFDPNRLYYVGQSLGALYGTLVTALDPDLPVAVLNAGGGSVVDIARWSPDFHADLVQTLAARQPSLLNDGSDFNENYVLRDRPVDVNAVPGAIEIQNYLERIDWNSMTGDPLAYASLLRPKKILFQFAIGDETVPNPTESALVRAAGGEASTWVFRNDLALAVYPTLPTNPHAYLTNVLDGTPALSIAFSTQTQIAGFFASNGSTIPDPNVAGFDFFQIPSPLPETLSFH